MPGRPTRGPTRCPLWIRQTAEEPYYLCGGCGISMREIHSWRDRRIRDLPCGSWTVWLHVEVHRVRCRRLLKEQLAQLWTYAYEGAARRFLTNWLLALRWQRLPAFQQLGFLLVRPSRRHPELLLSVKSAILRRPLVDRLGHLRLDLPPRGGDLEGQRAIGLRADHDDAQPRVGRPRPHHVALPALPTPRRRVLRARPSLMRYPVTLPYGRLSVWIPDSRSWWRRRAPGVQWPSSITGEGSPCPSSRTGHR